MDIDMQSPDQHAVTIWDRDRLTIMQQKLSETPKLLSVTSCQTMCSIFKVPQTLIDINGKSYQPQLVSIGPFHHGQPHLEMIEEHKWRLLRHLLNRTQAQGMVLEDYLRAVQTIEGMARECYSGTIPYTTEEFIEMMVLDGCFIIELFRMVGGVVEADVCDPLLNVSLILSNLIRDLIRLENQIPYFVLECLFQLTKTVDSPTLAILALGFFNLVTQRPKNVMDKYSNTKAKHLLDLLRSSFLPPDLDRSTKPDNRPPPHIICSISKLRISGIKLKPLESESFLVVNFKDGVIHMPTITLDDFMYAFLLNAVAFEQCYSGCLKIFTTYVTLLACLINTSEDLKLLCDWNIIENYLGKDAEVATYIINMGKEISFDIEVCYLAWVFYNINQRYSSSWHSAYHQFNHAYRNTPWPYLSALAASVLLILTVLQTVYTILSYGRSP